MEDPAKPYFYQGLTDRERAVFEGAIALATIYHQFVGTPVSRSRKVIRSLERAIERSILLQPFKEKVEVKIDPKRARNGKGPYAYFSLTGEMLEVKVVAKYGKARAYVAMRFIPELGYPLMYVEKVEENE